MLQALFCLILGNQVFARPQVNLVIDTGDSVTEVVRPEDKRRLLNEFQPISILRQSLPKFQGIVKFIQRESSGSTHLPIGL